MKFINDFLNEKNSSAYKIFLGIAILFFLVSVLVLLNYLGFVITPKAAPVAEFTITESEGEHQILSDNETAEFLKSLSDRELEELFGKEEAGEIKKRHER